MSLAQGHRSSVNKGGINSPTHITLPVQGMEPVGTTACYRKQEKKKAQETRVTICANPKKFYQSVGGHNNSENLLWINAGNGEGTRTEPGRRLYRH